jgi:hypothetical protein
MPGRGSFPDSQLAVGLQSLGSAFESRENTYQNNLSRVALKNNLIVSIAVEPNKDGLI